MPPEAPEGIVPSALTEGLLVHDEAADDALVVAAAGEAVPPEHDVEGLCGRQSGGEGGGEVRPHTGCRGQRS